MKIFIALLMIAQFAVVEARSFTPKKWRNAKSAPVYHESRLTRFEQAHLKNVQQERSQIERKRFIQNHFIRV